MLINYNYFIYRSLSDYILVSAKFSKFSKSLHPTSSYDFSVVKKYILNLMRQVIF